MRRTLGRRLALSGAAGFASIVSLGACSALVSTSGLSGGHGTQPDDSGPPASTTDATGTLDLGDATEPTSPPEAGPDDDASTDAPTQETDAARSDSGTPLVDAGAHDAGTDGATPACSGDLSNIGTGDFHITFTLRMTQSGLVALVNQRASCTPSTFWDLRLKSGEIQVETDDVTNYAALTGSGPDLDDGATHAVVVERVSGTLSIVVDGTNYGSTGSATSFGALAALTVGTDVCEQSGGDGTVALSGSLTNLCVASR